MNNTLIENNSATENKHQQKNTFDETYVLNQLIHYFPTQTPLKDFIHHNSLHAFQKLKFFDAIFKASKIFGYQVILELDDFRKLYNTRRIRKNILDKVITENKGIELVSEWKSKLLFKKYDASNTSKIGQLRTGWENNYKIDLDSLVQPLLFRLLTGLRNEFYFFIIYV